MLMIAHILNTNQSKASVVKTCMNEIVMSNNAACLVKSAKGYSEVETLYNIISKQGHSVAKKLHET